MGIPATFCRKFCDGFSSLLQALLTTEAVYLAGAVDK